MGQTYRARASQTRCDQRCTNHHLLISWVHPRVINKTSRSRRLHADNNPSIDVHNSDDGDEPRSSRSAPATTVAGQARCPPTQVVTHARVQRGNGIGPPSRLITDIRTSVPGMKKSLVISIALLLVLASCRKDEDPDAVAGRRTLLRILHRSPSTSVSFRTTRSVRTVSSKVHCPTSTRPSA